MICDLGTANKFLVVKGNKFLGRNTQNGEVLYLAFEDPEYRFSERMKLFKYDDCDDLIVYTKEKMGKNFDLEKYSQKDKRSLFIFGEFVLFCFDFLLKPFYFIIFHFFVAMY